MRLIPTTLRRNYSLVVIAVLAVADIADGVLAGTRSAFFYVFYLPLLGLMLLVAAVSSRRCRSFLVVVASGVAAASVALLLVGRGIPLSSSQTEAAVAAAHPNFRAPIRCFPTSGGGMLAQRYKCSWRKSIGFMGFDVDDSGIVRESP